MKTLKLLIATVAVGLGLTFAARAQNYYSARAVADATQINAGSAGVATNFTSVNYDPSNKGWLQTKAVTPTDLNANGVAFQFVTQQINTNNLPQFATNLTVTVGLALDDNSISSHLAGTGGYPFETANGSGTWLGAAGPYPIATNGQFTVSATVQQTTNLSAWIVQVPSTNFLGAKYFKVISAVYGGTNQLNIQSLRAGFYPGNTANN